MTDCSATEATVDTTLTLSSDITVTHMSCAQYGDGTCNFRATLRRNATSPGAPEFQCTGAPFAQAGSCSDSGSLTYVSGDELAFLIEDTGANCTDFLPVLCTVYYTF